MKNLLLGVSRLFDVEFLALAVGSFQAAILGATVTTACSISLRVAISLG